MRIGMSIAVSEPRRPAGGAFSPLATAPLWLIEPTSGQTGNSLAGSATWQLGATSGSETSDPTYNAGPPAYWSLDGGDYVEVLHPTPTLEPTFGTSDEWTLMIAFRYSTLPPSGTITLLSQKSGGVTSASPGPRLALSSTGWVQLLIGDGTTGVATSIVGIATTADQWAVAFAHTVSAANIAVRVNGAASSSSARPSGDQSPTLTGTRIARVAANYSTTSGFFTGDVRAVGAWQRQLTVDEMTDIESYYGAGT